MRQFEGTVVRQFGMMKGLGKTVWDDDGTMVKQFGMMKRFGETL